MHSKKATECQETKLMNTKKPIIPIFFSTDDNYAPYLGVALKSLVDNVSKDYLCKIYVLTTELSSFNRHTLQHCANGSNIELEFVNVQKALDQIGTKLHLRDYYSNATYYRFFIADLFPQYSKALYLDCDIVIRGDVSELYNIELGDKLLGAVREETVYQTPVFRDYVERVLEIPCDSYFNAGILSLNLNEFRRLDVFGEFVKLLGKRRFEVAQDQDYLNVIAYGNTVRIGIEWNKPPVPDEVLGTAAPKLAHFTLTRKPWNYDGILYGDIFWEYALKTPYANQLIQGLNEYSEESKHRDKIDFHKLCSLAAEQAAAAELTVLRNA